MSVYENLKQEQNKNGAPRLQYEIRSKRKTQLNIQFQKLSSIDGIIYLQSFVLPFTSCPYIYTLYNLYSLFTLHSTLKFHSI